MRKIYLTTALAAATLSTAAVAADWAYVTSGPDFDDYIDRESIRTMPNGNKRVWFWRVYAEPDQWGNTSSKNLMEFDCREWQWRILQDTYFKGDQATGTSNEISEWSYASPDSMGEILLNYVCFGKLPE